MSKYDALFEDETDIFGGTPQSKYWDIFNQVSQDLAKDEFDKLITKMAAMERLLMETMDEDALERNVNQHAFEHAMALEEHKKSLYMELAADLVYRISD